MGFLSEINDDIPDHLSVQVRVFRTLAGRTQRVYRQIWSGEPLLRFDAPGSPPLQHWVLKRPAQGFAMLTLGGVDPDDFSFDSYPQAWPLCQRLRREGLADAISALELRPVPYQPAPPRGRALLVAPFSTPALRAMTFLKDDHFRMEIQVLMLNQGQITPLFVGETRTRDFLAAPLGHMRKGQFDVQYLAVDQDGGPLAIASSCAHGYTSFSRQRCLSLREASRLLMSRGATALMIRQMGLPVSVCALQADRKAGELINRLKASPEGVSP